MYIKKFLYSYELQGSYGQGWECLCGENTYREALTQLKCYRENEGGNYRIKKVRDGLNPLYVSKTATH